MLLRLAVSSLAGHHFLGKETMRVHNSQTNSLIKRTSTRAIVIYNVVIISSKKKTKK